MISVCHDSHMQRYREPFGARPTGSSVRLSVDGNAGMEMTLRTWTESAGEARYSMIYNDSTGTYDFALSIPDEPCLIWYWFEVWENEVMQYYGNNLQDLGGEGALYGHEPPSFQITVYDAAFKTPAWFRHGMMYQIFPDRFFRAPGLESAAVGKKMLAWDERPDVPGTFYEDEEVADYFYGGNLKGIVQKLPYLKSLGVSAIYLNPIYLARSNHRYDVGHYMKVDPMLGGIEAFEDLCREAKGMGIRVIVDGVFSHTGSDSIYFNRYSNYDTVGAYQSKESPYHSWYLFNEWPDDYICWWDHPSLPHLDELDPEYMEYILGENGVIRFWLRHGASGWRLDVADELPVEFVTRLREVVKDEDPEALIIGEVWEDATHKIAYSEMRPYASGYQLDSVMNYPLRDALLDFFLYKDDAKGVLRRISSLQENYPPQMLHSLMNMTGTHDVARLRTILAGTPIEKHWLRDDMMHKPYLDVLGVGKSRALAFITVLFSLPGVPCVYYGDEIAMEGFADPYCRMPFDWSLPNGDMSARVSRMAALRRRFDCLGAGSFVPIDLGNPDVLAFVRVTMGYLNALGEIVRNDSLLLLVNRGDSIAHIDHISPGTHEGALEDLLGGTVPYCKDGHIRMALSPYEAALVLLSSD